MKYCPTCETTYDEEILRFCIKDGTPLVEQKEPEFKEIPSEAPDADDVGEQTVIRRNSPVTPPPIPDNFGSDTYVSAKTTTDRDGERIVVPTSNQQQTPTQSTTQEQGQQQYSQQNQPKDSQHNQGHSDQQQYSQGVRPIDAPRSEDRHKHKRKGGTAMVAAISIVGTLGVLALGFGVYWLVAGRNAPEEGVNTNIEVNLDDELDTNYNADDFLNDMNLNANLDDNMNANMDMNSNMALDFNIDPNPTPLPTLSKTPTPLPTPSVEIETTPTQSTPTPATPTPKPSTPIPTPTPAPTTPNSNSPVNVGQLNGRALSLPSPNYTRAARSAKAGGSVLVRVLLDEAGNVISANATTGHPLLTREAESAARRSKFKPVTISGSPVKATGTIAYKFVN